MAFFKKGDPRSQLFSLSASEVEVLKAVVDKSFLALSRTENVTEFGKIASVELYISSEGVSALERIYNSMKYIK